jgi:hypothetical protein
MQCERPSGLQFASTGSAVVLLPQAASKKRSPRARIVGSSYTICGAKSPVKPGAARYNRGVNVRAIIVVGSVVAGCGHPGGGGKATDTPKAKAGSGATTTVATVTPPQHPTSPPPPGFVPAPDIGCPTTTCVYHPGVAQYFTCLAGGAGVCFHFGAACTPSDKCMYDAADRTYKTCNTPGEGTCLAYGATCLPATKCMLEPATGLHKTCDKPGAGRCESFGALCSP